MSTKHPVKLNLGCGRAHLDGWINVDLAAPGHAPDIELDLEAPLDEWLYKLTPRFTAEHINDDGVVERALWGSNGGAVDHSQLIHVLEHLHKPLHVMQCLWYITRPGGTVEIRVPHGASDDAWADPTHVRPYFASSFAYFSQLAYWRADYGYHGDWELEEMVHFGWPDRPVPDEKATRFARNQIYEIKATLRAVKPARNPEDGRPTDA